MFQKDWSAAGGAVAIYVQDTLNPWRFRSHIPPALEQVAVEAFFSHRGLIFASIYLPPRSRVEMEERVSDLVDWLASLGPSVLDLVLFGDFNLCPLDNHEVWQHNVLANLSSTFGLSQIVQHPTHGN